MIRAISAQPNIVCKVSGLVGYSSREAWAPEDVRPCVHHVVDCFGWAGSCLEAIGLSVRSRRALRNGWR
jgi:predicted TIM-barrel fold metal-dependent hydrolase